MKEENVYEKLQKCRVELQKMKLKKSGKNNFAGFAYYELADFLPAINELFSKNGLSSMFSIHEDEATLTIINSNKTDETITFTSPIADANIKGCTPVQSLGGVHTYLKRYLYINALEIVENDMFDGKVGNMEVEVDTTDYKALVEQYINENNIDKVAFCKAYKLNAKSTNEDFKRAYKKVEVK